jgi:hypothetical protein
MNKKQKKWAKLATSIAIDAIGMFSYPLDLLFGVGEVTDAPWAVVSALSTQLLYGNIAFSALNLTEELLPFADFIPTSTIAWYYYYYGGK